MVGISATCKEYVGSGGRKAVERKIEFIFEFYWNNNALPSLAAIRDGNGGQQKRQQRSRIESVFIIHSSEN